MPLPHGLVTGDKIDPTLLKSGVIQDRGSVRGVEELKKAAEELTKVEVPNTAPLQAPTPIDFASLPTKEREDLLKDINRARELGISESDGSKPAESAAPESASAESAPSEAAASAHTLQNCPYCGWKLDQEVVEVTEEDRQQWLRSILGGERFVKTYSVYNGNLKIEFRCRTSREADLITEQIGLDMKHGRHNTAVEQMHWLRRYMFVTSLSRISVGAQSSVLPEIMPCNGESSYKLPTTPDRNMVGVVTQDFLQRWQDALLEALLSIYSKFELLVGKLQQEAWKTDFFGSGSGRA